jgi:hypothetical protein
MKYMAAVARRLYHARDLGEPFDFLTWFANVALDRRMDVRRTRSRHPARAIDRLLGYVEELGDLTDAELHFSS